MLMYFSGSGTGILENRKSELSQVSIYCANNFDIIIYAIHVNCATVNKMASISHRDKMVCDLFISHLLQ